MDTTEAGDVARLQVTAGGRRRRGPAGSFRATSPGTRAGPLLGREHLFDAGNVEVEVELALRVVDQLPRRAPLGFDPGLDLVQSDHALQQLASVPW